MSRLSKEELLDWLDKQSLENGWNIRWNEKDNIDLQAYQQIKQMIQKPGEEEIEIRYIEIILDLYDRLEKKKPIVTREFVEKWKKHLIDTGTQSYMQAEHNVRQMLKEAGVEITK